MKSEIRNSKFEIRTVRIPVKALDIERAKGPRQSSRQRGICVALGSSGKAAEP